MIFSTVVAASILALIPSSLALAIGTRDNTCTFVCPQNDAHGNGLSGSSVNGNSLSCTYAGGSGNLCIYDIASGALNGNKDGCPGQAVQQCTPHQRREGSQPDSKVASSSSPSSNPSTGEPKSNPTTEQPAHNFKCPQKDSVQNPLTNEVDGDSALDCSYSTSDCKYNTATGALLEDHDGGHCPQTAALSQ